MVRRAGSLRCRSAWEKKLADVVELYASGQAPKTGTQDAFGLKYAPQGEPRSP